MCFRIAKVRTFDWQRRRTAFKVVSLQRKSVLANLWGAGSLEYKTGDVVEARGDAAELGDRASQCAGESRVGIYVCRDLEAVARFVCSEPLTCGRGFIVIALAVDPADFIHHDRDEKGYATYKKVKVIS
jgi:hypothetical protein